MSKFLLFVLMLSSFLGSAHAQSTQTERRIGKLQDMLRQNAEEYQELHAWSKSGFQETRPSVSGKVIKIVGFLGKLYAKRSKEVKRRPALAAEYQKRARHYYDIYKNYSPNRTVTTVDAIRYTSRINPSSVLHVGYLRAPLAATVSFSGGETYDVTSAFSGLSLGGGWRTGGKSSWDVDAAFFILNGTVTVSDEDYEQSDAISKGVYVLGGKSFAISDAFLLGLQAGFAWQDLTVTAEEGVEASATSSIVPLVSVHAAWQLNQTISVQPRVMYWKGMALGAWGNYHF